MRNTTLCHIEKDGKYLMLHCVKKENDLNKDKWIDKKELYSLPIWEGDKIFLDLIDRNIPFFSLKLEYAGDMLVKAILDGKDI